MSSGKRITCIFLVYILLIFACGSFLQTAAYGVDTADARELPKEQRTLHVSLGESRLEYAIGLSSVNLSAVTALVVEDGVLLEEDFRWLRNTMGKTLEKFDSRGATVDDNRLCDRAFANMTELRTVLLPDSLAELGNYAFFNCQNLDGIELPEVKTVGVGAFAFCSALAEAKMPVAETLHNSAFLFCDKLAEVELPKIASVGDFTFGWCKSIRALELPNLSLVGKGSFTACVSLSHVTLSSVGSLNEILPETTDANVFADSGIAVVTAVGDVVFGQYEAPDKDAELQEVSSEER